MNQELSAEENKADTSLVLRADEVYFSYSKNKPILNGATLEIYSGEIVTISGENGSGKSTFLKLLVNLLIPKRGQIYIKGPIGYSPQELLLYENLTIMENFRVFGKAMKLSKEQAIDTAQEIAKELQFTQYLHTLVKHLSGGTAQKVNFGLSLLGDPNILILDEPYQGMDYSSFMSFWEIQKELRKKGKTIIIVSHLIDERDKVSRSIHLVQGKLQECTGEDCLICGGVKR